MTLFGPRIRKIQMNATHGLTTNMLCQKDCGICSKHTHVFQSPTSDTVHSISVVLASPLNSQKINIQLDLGLIHNKRPLTRPYFNVYRCVTSEQVGEA